jgi:hypothetical protein
MVERGHRSTWLWHGDGTRAESASLAMRQAGRPARPGLLVCGGAPRRNRPGDPILTMEPSGTAVRTTLSPGHARPYRPKLSVLFRQSYALTLAPCPDRRWRSHHSRSKDRQLSYLPASLILIPFPLGGGSAVLGVERGIGQEGHGGVGRPQDRSGVNRNTRRPDPSSPSSRPGTDEGQCPDAGRSRWPWPAPRMVEWFWAAIVVVNRVAEAHRRPHGVSE